MHPHFSAGRVACAETFSSQPRTVTPHCHLSSIAITPRFSTEKTAFVLDDITVNGTLVIPKGGLAFATVTEAQAKRRMARGGKLDINIDYGKVVSGERAPLRAVKDMKGGGHTGVVVGGIVATGILFFPAGPVFSVHAWERHLPSEGNRNYRLRKWRHESGHRQVSAS
jgi:hypothetical protein